MSRSLFALSLFLSVRSFVPFGPHQAPRGLNLFRKLIYDNLSVTFYLFLNSTFTPVTTTTTKLATIELRSSSPRDRDLASLTVGGGAAPLAYFLEFGFVSVNCSPSGSSVNFCDLDLRLNLERLGTQK